MLVICFLTSRFESCYALSMSLLEEIGELPTKQKKYLLLRISGIDTSLALSMSKGDRLQYNNWMKNQSFTSIHKRLPELESKYKQEAAQLLRRNNQLEAVLLEGTIVEKMKAEIESGDYDLIRTNLAREVYSKLMAELDQQPKVPTQTWEMKIGQIVNNPIKELPEVIDLEETKVIDAETV